MIIRAEHKAKVAPYAIYSLKLIQENKLPYGPKCLLLLMLSYPDYWGFTLDSLSATMGEPVSTIREWLIILHRYGYFHEDVVSHIGNAAVPAKWLISEYPVEVK